MLVDLNSPGGDVEESLKIATVICTRKAKAVVNAKQQCDGACFVLFAAGRVRMAAASASIGVFTVEQGAGPGENLHETFREVILLSGMGVPDPILFR